MKTQKKLAGRLMKTSPNKIVFDNSRLADIKEAITKTDIRNLIGEKAITKKPDVGNGRARARKIKIQKSKNLRKGAGSREGKHTARLPRKENWMNKVRSQRKFLAELKESKLITNETYKNIYYKIKGGYFRSKRHIKLYLNDKNLFIKK